MSTRAFDIDDDLGEHVTHPDDYGSEQVRPHALMARVVLALVVLACLVVIASALTGWKAEEVARWLP